MVLEFSNILSVFALVVAIFSLVWSVYRDVRLKSRLKVSIIVLPPTNNLSLGTICFNVVNCGPIPVDIRLLVFQVSWWKNILQHGNMENHKVVEDELVSDSDSLPTKINTAQTKRYYFRLDKECFLNQKPISIGVFDSFHRYTRAPRMHVRLAMKSHKKTATDIK